jgi:hypothetical protein
MGIVICHETQTWRCTCGRESSIPSHVMASGEKLAIFHESIEAKHKCDRSKQKHKNLAPTLDDRWQQLFAPVIKELSNEV